MPKGEFCSTSKMEKSQKAKCLERSQHLILKHLPSAKARVPSFPVLRLRRVALLSSAQDHTPRTIFKEVSPQGPPLTGTFDQASFFFFQWAPPAGGWLWVTIILAPGRRCWRTGCPRQCFGPMQRKTCSKREQK